MDDDGRTDLLPRERMRPPIRAVQLVPADLDDAHVQHARPAVSASPSITFMF